MTANNPSERMCAVCRTVKAKSALLRIVRLPSGEFVIDESGKADGRGAYICKDVDCAEKCVKKRLLNRSFKENLPDTVYEAIRERLIKN